MDLSKYRIAEDRDIVATDPNAVHLFPSERITFLGSSSRVIVDLILGEQITQLTHDLTRSKDNLLLLMEERLEYDRMVSRDVEQQDDQVTAEELFYTKVIRELLLIPFKLDENDFYNVMQNRYDLRMLAKIVYKVMLLDRYPNILTILKQDISRNSTQYVNQYRQTINKKDLETYSERKFRANFNQVILVRKLQDIVKSFCSRDHSDITLVDLITVAKEDELEYHLLPFYLEDYLDTASVSSYMAPMINSAYNLEQTCSSIVEQLFPNIYKEA